MGEKEVKRWRFPCRAFDTNMTYARLTVTSNVSRRGGAVRRHIKLSCKNHIRSMPKCTQIKSQLTRWASKSSVERLRRGLRLAPHADEPAQPRASETKQTIQKSPWLCCQAPPGRKCGWDWTFLSSSGKVNRSRARRCLAMCRLS